MDENYSRRKVLLIVGGFAVFIIVLQLVWNFFTTGTIIVTTDNPKSSITLSRVNPKNVGGAPYKSYSGHSRLSEHVHLGEYLATVKSGSSSSTQIINLKSHKTLSYHINPAAPLPTEPVALLSANDMNADTNGLVFLNTATNHVNEIMPDNNIKSIDSSVQFGRVRWITSSYGIGQSTSSNNNLFVINNSNVSKVELPSSVSANGNTFSFDVTPSKQIYVTTGGNVYSGTDKGNFKKVYTAPTSYIKIGAANSKFAAAYHIGNSASGNDDSLVLAVVSQSGKVKKIQVNDDISSLIWSPDQQYLATLNESSISIYNSSLKRVALIPTNYQTGFMDWVNDRLVYASSAQVLTYDLQSQQLSVLANAPGGNSAVNLSVNADGSYVYVAFANNATNNPQIVRIGLKGQKPSVLAGQLADLLPMDLSNGTMSLSNFTRPAILIIPDTGPSLSQAAYIQQAQSQIQQLGLNTTGLSFYVNSDISIRD